MRAVLTSSTPTVAPINQLLHIHNTNSVFATKLTLAGHGVFINQSSEEGVCLAIGKSDVVDELWLLTAR